MNSDSAFLKTGGTGILCSTYYVSGVSSFTCPGGISLSALIVSYFQLQFGQVGAGDNADHCSPAQVNFPEEQVWHVFGRAK